MMNVRAFEKRSVTQDRRLLVPSIHRQAFEWDLFTVYVHHKTDETEIREVVRFCTCSFIFLLLLLLLLITSTPESPTFFAAIGKRQEARVIFIPIIGPDL
jgi:hypothetical protein